MKKAVIGLDTSNYRTSLCVLSTEGEILVNYRKLLPVPPGQRGLRQNEAVFSHIKQLAAAEPEIRKITGQFETAAVSASVSPRDGEDSYMPVFQAGTSFGRTMAAIMGVPFFATTHQRGHLAAASMGTCLENETDYLALHLSGGTTDLLHVREGLPVRIGGSLDLHAGQLVDRVGVAMGLPFPSGPELEKIALSGTTRSMIGCSMENGDLYCHFSGAEAQVMRWLSSENETRENIAAEVYDFLARTIIRMISAGIRNTGIHKVLITGGVASSPLLRAKLAERISRQRNLPDPVFGDAELSGDNAVGVALIGLREFRKQSAEQE